MTDDSLPKDLQQWASELKTRPLAAAVPNRDQLMFDCGLAARSHETHRRSPPKPHKNQTIRQCLIVVCSISLGAILMHWSSPSARNDNRSRQVVEETTVPPFPREQSAERRPSLSSAQLAAIQSGRLLHASSQLITTNSYHQSKNEPALAPDATIYRAGLPNRIDLVP